MDGFVESRFTVAVTEVVPPSLVAEHVRLRAAPSVVNVKSSQSVVESAFATCHVDRDVARVPAVRRRSGSPG